MNPPRIDISDSDPRRPRAGRLWAASIIALIVICGGLVALRSGGPSPPDPAPVAPVQTTGTPAPVTAPPVRVPERPRVPAPAPAGVPSAPTSVPTPPAPAPEDAAPGTGTARQPARAVPSVNRLYPNVRRPRIELTYIDWPDKRQAAAAALDVAQAIALSDGRNGAALTRALSAKMAPNALDQLRGMLGNGLPLGPRDRLRGRLLSGMMGRDPQTGARYANIVYQRTVNGTAQEGIVRVELAPAQPVVTAFEIIPLVSQ